MKNKKAKYFLLREKAVPEVLLKVIEMKQIMEMDREIAIQDAANQVGISRSSFYKYKDDIFPFHESTKGHTITLVIQIDDTPGTLSDIMLNIAKYKGNILTIHQSIPVHKIATVTMSVQILSYTGNVSEMVEELEGFKGIYDLKLIGREH